MPGAPAIQPPQEYNAARFLTRAWEERLEILRHLIDHSRQILLILGEQGSGKSTLRDCLAGGAVPGWRVMVIDATPFDNAAVLLERLATALGLNPAPKDRLEDRVQAMEEQLQALRHTGVSPVALIDEAHQLPADSLLLLLRLAASEAAALRVVLFCDPRVTRLLESPQLQAFQRAITHTIEMPAYTLEETASFLAWRYACTGRDPNQLVEARVRAIHQASQGLPGRILALDADPAMTDVPEKNRVAPRGRTHAAYFVAGVSVFLLLMALAVFVWRKPDAGEAAPPSTAPETPPANAAVTAPAQATGQTAVTPAANPTATTNSSATVAGPPALSATADTPAKTPPHSATAAETKMDKITAHGETPPPAAITAGRATPPAADNTRAPHDEAWLRRQSTARYVIQLFGSHDRNAALKYAQRPDLSGHTAIYTNRRETPPLHVVVYGLYASREEAAGAVARLPADVAREKPFPRSVGEIQQLMEAKARSSPAQ